MNDNTANSPITASGALRQVGPLLKLNATKVYGNTATGAGVSGGGGIYTGGNLELVDSDVFDNTVTNTDANASGDGAGISVAGGAKTLTGSLVTRKQRGDGDPHHHDGDPNVPNNCSPAGSIAGCIG